MRPVLTSDPRPGPEQCKAQGRQSRNSLLIEIHMERASQNAVRPRQALTHGDLPTTYPAHDNRGRSLRQHRLGRRRVMSVLPSSCRHKRPSLPLPGALWKTPTRAPASQHPDGKRQKVTENRQQQSLRGGGAPPACLRVHACACAHAPEAARGRLPVLTRPTPVLPTPEGNLSPASHSTSTGAVDRRMFIYLRTALASFSSQSVSPLCCELPHSRLSHRL